MKKITLSLLIFLSTNILAATTTVDPFSFEFFTHESKINVKATLVQSCRYERIVWGDSSEYNTSYNQIPLTLKNTNLRNGLVRHQVSLSTKQVMSVSGAFKPTKGCKSDIKIELVDAIYSVGWANQYSRPINFEFYDIESYRPGNTELDTSKIEDQMGNKTFSYLYTPKSSQVNINLLADGNKLYGFSKSAAINKKTQMPFKLR
ncbi:hypothetical protein [Halobacteriovorax sp. JY17]|uniref:hypothetical protein n=1 Tax=Halobacteriovorax sp. JY17 TaxID=2014617 RepID=UPI000C4CEA01|nr:hypothetical protein [Halobacteriovorax sp. JY17]PIK15218.1 MAG: hypothetical protein CES88_00470 [Halobacteriovorax sp. JY17]